MEIVHGNIMQKLKLLPMHENMYLLYAYNLHIHIKYIQKEIACLKKQQLFIHLLQTKHRDLTVSKILLLIAGASRHKGGHQSSSSEAEMTYHKRCREVDL